MRGWRFASVLLAAVVLPVAAQAKSDGIEKAGQAIAIAMPILAGGISLAHNDWNGLAQMSVVTGASVGTAFGLKYVIHEERPDHSDNKSFPSDTAALAFGPAAYLWDRYGWEYGLPAYLLAGFVGYSRVEAKQHHWWDVAASGVISFGYSKLFTTHYMRAHNIYGQAYATPHSVYVGATYTF